MPVPDNVLGQVVITEQQVCFSIIADKELQGYEAHNFDNLEEGSWYARHFADQVTVIIVRQSNAEYEKWLEKSGHERV